MTRVTPVILFGTRLWPLSRSGFPKQFLVLGSSHIYPKLALQSVSEKALLTGKLEPTNGPNAIAEIAGIKMGESCNRQYGHSHVIEYRSVMPTNLYGPRDNYHPENSHVIPALIMGFHEAKIANAPEVVIWGTGVLKREFLYADDMAEASVYVMGLDKVTYDGQTQPMQSHINVGFGSDVTIYQQAHAVAKATGYQGSISFDPSKPHGYLRKLMGLGRLNKLGWNSQVGLEQSLVQAYANYLKPHVCFTE